MDGAGCTYTYTSLAFSLSFPDCIRYDSMLFDIVISGCHDISVYLTALLLSLLGISGVYP
ncbi:hypothetical protein M404DRAFT_1006576 [Pisolithus tinctorius Marx 270]|uniref:Uncharacterized protein n=1 Tax=Pisolithus tinctorius Marx 270 TaxID=870435 RepID=A0A0C3NM50_PISTI|nr:hypothetical protein M404DRAFT_1009371 [Pisolithus tinctorius Marx 270]KIN96705.1 hypothetical protein M404DRAFT_1006576 [Pisolithus tinctorius Marx 270]